MTRHRRTRNPRGALEQTLTSLHKLKLRAKKGLGQHFLVDEGVLEQIISAASLDPTDTVIEVGPGLGTLTRELAKRAGRVIAMELDARLAAALVQTLSLFPNLTIINADVLDTDPAKLVTGSNYKVVANIPYYITAPVFRHFLEASLKPKRLVLMIQKEVAQTIVAAPGDLSLLGVSVQLYGKPEIVGYVPANSFYPPPKVDSAIVRIDVYERPMLGLSDIEGFFEVVRAGFCAPRKQLHNALTRGLALPPQEVSGLLEQAHIAPQRRAQTLSLEEWAELHSAFSETRKK